MKKAYGILLATLLTGCTHTYQHSSHTRWNHFDTLATDQIQISKPNPIGFFKDITSTERAYMTLMPLVTEPLNHPYQTYLGPNIGIHNHIWNVGVGTGLQFNSPNEELRGEPFFGIGIKIIIPRRARRVQTVTDITDALRNKEN
jgi:hypothetical protein